jgi:hypothetical protein
MEVPLTLPATYMHLSISMAFTHNAEPSSA